MPKNKSCNYCKSKYGEINSLKTTYYRNYDHGDTDVKIDEIQFCGNCRQYFDISLDRDSIIENLKNNKYIPGDTLRPILNSFYVDNIDVDWTIWKHDQYEIEIGFYGKLGYWKTFDDTESGDLELDGDLSELTDEQRQKYAKRLSKNK